MFYLFHFLLLYISQIQSYTTISLLSDFLRYFFFLTSTSGVSLPWQGSRNSNPTQKLDILFFPPPNFKITFFECTKRFYHLSRMYSEDCDLNIKIFSYVLMRFACLFNRRIYNLK